MWFQGMPLSALLLALLPATAAGTEARGAAGPPLSPRNASYVIEARLDASRHALSGTEVLAWRNITTRPTSELRLHLYFNAWRNAGSSWLRSAARGASPPDLSAYRAEDWGACDVGAVRLLPEGGGAPVPLDKAFVQPDDGNPEDRTVMRVALPRPVGPGETVRVQVEWTLKIPRPLARAGVLGRYYMMGQWFPKVGVLEADGAWNCHQFIQTEFYADYGSYDVALTVPAGWTVGATGLPVAEAAAPGGGVTHRFHADDVHDFAWTTSPLFTLHRARFESPGLPPVDIELLLLPEHAVLRDRYLEATRTALRLYGEWLEPYPYPRITVVDPPDRSETGGMEYPMLVTGESRWPVLPGNRLAEANTLHEVGHQWWYGLVANDEFEDAWLDEGLNTYTHKRILRLVYGPTTYEKRYFHDLLPCRFEGIHTAQPTEGADAYDGFRSPLKREPLGTPAFRGDERIYYLNAYGTGSRLCVTLERLLGWETWRRVLATYARRFSFRHPRPADFFAVVDEVAGRDLGWFTGQVYGTANVFDYAVDRVVSRRVESALGGYDSIVDVRRWGEGTFPVGVRVRFEDGHVTDERWDGQARWTRYHYVTPAPVAQVEVDPEEVLVLDVNSANNSWTRHPEAPAAAAKWTARWTVWLQSLMELAAFFS